MSTTPRATLQPGLAAFLPELRPEQDPETGQGVLIPTGKIHPHPQNGRTVFDEEYIAGLAQDILARGLRNKVEVKKRSDGDWEIVTGHCRHRAHVAARLEFTPCIIRNDLDEAGVVDARISENWWRRDLLPLEEAREIHTALQVPGRTQKDVAEQLRVSASLVQARLRLLRIPEAVDLRVGVDLTQEHADLFLPFEDHPDLLPLAVASVGDEPGRPWDVQRGIKEALIKAGKAADPFDWQVMEKVGRSNDSYEARVAKLPSIKLGADRQEMVLVLDLAALETIVAEETARNEEAKKEANREVPDYVREQRERQAVERAIKLKQLELAGKSVKSMISWGRREDLLMHAQTLDYQPRTKREWEWLADVTGLEPDMVRSLVARSVVPSKALESLYDAQDKWPLKRLVAAVMVLRAGGWNRILDETQSKEWTGQSTKQLRSLVLRQRAAAKGSKRPKKAAKAPNGAKKAGKRTRKGKVPKAPASEPSEPADVDPDSAA